MSNVKIACVQTDPILGDVRGNVAVTVSAVSRAALLGAQLVVLPELATSGYMFSDQTEARAAAQTRDGPALGEWAAEARRSQVVIVGGFCELDTRNGKIYNSAAVIDRSGIRCVYRKTHLWNKELDLFAPGDEPAPVVETDLGMIGLAICADISYPEVARCLALAGADVIVLPSNCPRKQSMPGEEPEDVAYYRSAALLNVVYVAVSDRCGHERNIDWLGWSVVVDPRGRVVAGPIPEGGAGMVLAECDFALARDKSWGPRNDLFRDRRPELYRPRTHPRPV